MGQSLQNQGIQLLKAGQYDAAATCFEQLISQHPDNAHVLNLLGITRSRQGNYPEALALMTKAITLDESSAEIHHNIGPIYRVIGDFEQAENHYREAIRLKPDYAEAYFNLAAVKTFAAADPTLASIETLIEGDELRLEDRCFLHFAAGKMYDDAQNYDKAFAHYQRGNTLRDVHYQPDEHRRLIGRIMEAFSPGLFARHEAANSETRTPIFVVGMPRSGTTLVEQILASHPEVYGAGELPDITNIIQAITRQVPGNSGSPNGSPNGFPEYASMLSDRVIRGFADSYLRRIRSISATAQHIVDKMPQNYLFLGMIHLMFPQARIVNCRRHPLDTCLSCYFQRFRTSQEYSYDLGHLGHHYRGYERLMAHWRQVLPTPVVDARYEELVEQPEQAIRTLLDQLDLPWNEACLKPHATQRPVTTASNLQVRQPLYRTSVKRWERYAEHLTPLMEAMGWHDE